MAAARFAGEADPSRHVIDLKLPGRSGQAVSRGVAQKQRPAAVAPARQVNWSACGVGVGCAKGVGRSASSSSAGRRRPVAGQGAGKWRPMTCSAGLAGRLGTSSTRVCGHHRTMGIQPSGRRPVVSGSAR